MDQTQTIDQIGQVIVDAAVKLSGADVIVLGLLNEESKRLDLIATGGLNVASIPAERSLPMEAPSLATRVVRTEQPQEILVGDTDELDLSLTRKIAKREKLRTLFYVPLAIDGRPTGVLGAAFRAARRLTADERERLQAIADLGALALDRMRLRDAMNREQEAARNAAELLRELNNRLIISNIRQMDLQEAAQRQATSILDKIGDAVYIVDAEWRFTFVNQKAEELWGKSREHLTGKELWSEFPALVGTGSEEELRTAARERRPVEFEALSPLLGQWIEAKVYPIENDLLVYVRDITERKRAEAEREDLLKQLAAVIEQSPLGILLVEGPNGERVLANRSAEELFGRTLPPERGIEQYVGQVFDLERVALPRSRLAVECALRGEIVAADEELLRQPGGREVRVLVNARPIWTDGQVAGAVVMYLDITRIRELEREREEWLSIITHDLRQPLTVIYAYGGLLKKNVLPRLDAREARALTNISQAAENLNKMITDLRNISQLETQGFTLSRGPMDLPSFVRSVVERSAELTVGHSVRVEVLDPLPPVEIDASRVEQVLGNLLSNAAKYGYPDTDILVTVQQKDGFAEVAVTERGPGIQPNELPRIFNRFYRTNKAEAKGVDGLGLGLYISKRIVESHGGRIWAESVPDQTTTFHFTLPLAES